MTQPILEAKGLSRSFGHVRALTKTDFDIYPGEVVAIIGDNGAGKSTLVKALTGNLALDEGELYFQGQRVNISSPQEASALGMEVVYQDLALAPHLNPVQNMFLGREIPRKGFLGQLGFMDEKAMRRGRGLRRAGRDRAFDARPHRLDVRRAASAGGDRPGHQLGRQGRDPRRADGRARRRPDPERAGQHQARQGQGHRGDPHLALHAARAGGRRPGPGAAPGHGGWPPTRPRDQCRRARRRHDRRPGQEGGQHERHHQARRRRRRRRPRPGTSRC